MSTIEAEAPQEVRDRLCIALDTDDLVAARRMARDVAPWFGTAKIGLELFTSAGPDAVVAMQELGLKVFVDLKLHDIPTTVQRAARVLGSLGIDFLTFHAHGGVEMLQAGVEGVIEGAESAQVPVPTPLAVTVLTSDDTAPTHVFAKRVESAIGAGCAGLVCAVADVAEARAMQRSLFIAATGIRAPGQPAHDQRRVATPGDAFTAGADLVVLGRSISLSDDPAGTAAALVDNTLS
ncbi:MAG: orotidine-5'-phosphate decarboxylase [Acidimicrobiales bacterium]|nr:orotidine-5'-phosphate decarboxylase [Acidimicrobiales bacterium]